MRNISLALVAMMCVLTAAGRTVTAGVEGDVELLRLVAEGNRANRERIETWRLRAVENMTSNLHSPGVWKESTIELYCVHDLNRNAKRWGYLPLTYRATDEDGVVIEEAKPDSDYQAAINGMVMEGTLYQYYDYTPKSVTSGKPLIIDHVEGDAYMRANHNRDGFYYFGIGHGGGSVYSHLMFYVRKHDSPALRLKVSRSGDIITVETETEQSKGVKRYDASCGYNLVELSSDTVTDTKEVLWHHKWEWENVGGVFVPAKVEYENEVLNVDGSGDHGVQKGTITFDSNEVNVPIDPSEFTLAAMGVKPGDMVQDRRTGVTYEYGLSESNEPTLRSAGLDDVVESLDDITPDDVAIEGTETAVETTVQPEAATDGPPAPQESSGQGRTIWRECILVAIGLMVLIIAVLLVRKRAGGAGR